MVEKRLLLLVPLFARFLCSCSDSALVTHELTLAPPPRPEAWQSISALEFLVAWEDAEGQAREILLTEGRELRVKLRRGEPCAIVAETFFGNSRLRSAAALYPRDLDSSTKIGGFFSSLMPGRLRLDYMKGYIAEVSSCLGRIGEDPWAYPLERLAEELSLRRADPWSVPPSEAAEDLALHGFRIDSYARKGLEVVLPESEGWIPESPFCELRRDGEAQKAILPEGISIFYDDARKLIVSVNAAGPLFQVLPRLP